MCKKPSCWLQSHRPKQGGFYPSKPLYSLDSQTNDSTPFENLGLSSDFPPSLSVAVPSRVLGTNSSHGPLDGLRFAVKDLFNIEGLRPTVGCRAYYAVAEQSNTTAPALQKLIDIGANLLGTLKLGSLITKEEPAESADYQAPFNPRGDGYQSAWSSSGGSGAAVASYDWVDFTLGTDSKLSNPFACQSLTLHPIATGSSRRPALANGCFQLRLSHDALSQDGIIPSFRCVLPS
jgi:Asp-tRNA(Asn)/Glu-tRNA(Gln) amidotransferase A subunit family amidase